ncbi:TlpA disulfide reductase family protein [Pedobacter metabolipauper]|uniref:Peroxiredoxin n=1 Tax=Pedobacter metabolipauper TaxID=425513 RepID=A0A4V3D1H0_9SPHI|nr:TlpA disulfide reductase family protein [Pedobacter metabolipauper]TDQ11163.1 peroxiredoxin [Pedobacter metabolipauper]
MKTIVKNIGYILILGIALTACGDKSKFTINGQFTNAVPQGKVYLFDIQKESAVAIDSTVFSEKGEFTFSHSTPGVDFFRISSGNHEYMIIAKNGDVIKITADLSDKNLAYNISGAMEADKLQEFNTTRHQYISRMSAIQAQFEETVAAQPDKREMIRQQVEPKYIEELQGLNQSTLKFAQDNPQSLAGFYAINLLNPAEYENEMVAYSDQIKSSFNDNKMVTEFLKRMSALKSLQPGHAAPDFTSTSIDGKSVKLSDFKGKYVLLDFWASWCAPCRQENPNIVKAYQTFKDKNFTVLGVSLDKDPVAWKKAVEADQLTWNHVSELKDFEGSTVKLYQIQSIPASFLIDPTGKIVAKGLRGAALDEFLNKTLR